MVGGGGGGAEKVPSTATTATDKGVANPICASEMSRDATCM